MRFPVVRERVRVQGREGTFLVLSVDRARGVVHIVSAERGAHVQEELPIASILRLSDENLPDERLADYPGSGGQSA